MVHLIAAVLFLMAVPGIALAGGGAPEVPSNFAPAILVGLLGIVMGIRYFRKK